MNNLEEKVILMFGGSGGIGAAVARMFAKMRRKIVISSNKEAVDYEMTKELIALGAEAEYISGDYTQSGFVEKVYNYTEETFGVPDIIICCAGMGDNIEEMGNIDAEIMDLVFRVNIVGPYLVLQEGVNRLQMSDKPGKIIVLGSICSHYTSKNGAWPIYTASKAALCSLMESARRQICKEGNKIGFTIVCPGTTNTSLVLGETGEPEDRFMEPEQVAECIVSAATLPDTMAITDISMLNVQQDIF